MEAEKMNNKPTIEIVDIDQAFEEEDEFEAISKMDIDLKKPMKNKEKSKKELFIEAVNQCINFKPKMTGKGKFRKPVFPTSYKLYNTTFYIKYPIDGKEISNKITYQEMKTLPKGVEFFKEHFVLDKEKFEKDSLLDKAKPQREYYYFSFSKFKKTLLKCLLNRLEIHGKVKLVNLTIMDIIKELETLPEEVNVLDQFIENKVKEDEREFSLDGF